MSSTPKTNRKLVTKTVDLRPALLSWGLGARPQKKRPTCSVFATTNATEYAVAVRLKKGVKLSQEYLNWAKNVVEGKKQDGDFFHIIWAGYQQKGICTEEMHPYQETYNDALTPSLEAKKDAETYKDLGLELKFIKNWDVERGLTPKEFRAVLRKIEQGWPVMCGMRWPKEMAKKNDVMTWQPSDQVFDGHSILFVGYVVDRTVEGGGYFIVSDSGCNSNESKISFKYVRAYANDACWVE
jgi:hypothetical protein